MKALFLIILSFWSFGIFAQSGVAFLVEELPEDSIVRNRIQHHSAIRPFIRQPQHVVGTTLRKAPSDSRFTIAPLVDFNGAYSDSLAYRAGGGLVAELNTGKWYARIAGVAGVGSHDSVFQTTSFYREPISNGYVYTDVRGRISYTPNDIFNFQIGLDNQFIGEGNRSLLLGDYGVPSPFAMIRTNFWRLDYTVLYQFFREKVPGQWKSKYATTHYLSFNAARWLNFGLFETVLFQPKDTLLNRGFDAEYLNPVIFFRPQEYSLGSSDNILLGFSAQIRLKAHSIYGQLMLDEFNLAEIKAKSKWWASKYGIQAGVKGRFKTIRGHYFYRVEYNFIRPYTYAHIDESQNYGNQGRPLAHPLESNFHELLGELKWQHKKWFASAFVSYYLKGLDKDGYSYGGDVYQSYLNLPYEYGHTTGQGRGVNRLHAMLTLDYAILPQARLHVFLENHLRFDTLKDAVSYYPVCGIRSKLWNDYRNY